MTTGARTQASVWMGMLVTPGCAPASGVSGTHRAALVSHSGAPTGGSGSSAPPAAPAGAGWQVVSQWLLSVAPGVEHWCVDRPFACLLWRNAHLYRAARSRTMLSVCGGFVCTDTCSAASPSSGAASPWLAQWRPIDTLKRLLTEFSSSEFSL